MATTTKQDRVRELQRALYRAAKADPHGGSRMPAVKNVGEPCAGEPHARFEVAAGGNLASRHCRAALAPPADPTSRSSASQSQRRSRPARSPRRLDPRVRTRRMTPRMTTTEFLHPTPPIRHSGAGPCRLHRRFSAQKLQNRLHTRTIRPVQGLNAYEKAPLCGAFAEPSSGLEPETPSLRSEE